MKPFLFLLLCIGIARPAAAQPASIDWLQTITNGTLATNVVTDGAGNIYTAGKGNSSLTVGGITSADIGVYLCKNNAAGTPLWLARSKWAASYNVRQIAVDSHCNVYVRGYFSDSIGFGSLPVINPTEYDDNADFIVKYDSSGTALWDTWVLPAIGTNSMVVDDSDNLIVAGSYIYFACFGSVADSLPLSNSYKGFIAKFNGADGSLAWKKAVDAYSINELAADKDGNIYASGLYTSPFTVDGISLGLVGNGTNPTSFIAKLDGGGHAIWANAFSNYGSTPNYFGTLMLKIAVNGYGGCYIVGNIGGDATFGTTSLPLATGNAFMARYADDGALQWAQTLSTGNLTVTGANADTAGNIFLSLQKSFYSGSSAFGNTSIPAPDTSGNVTMAVAETDTAGIPLWAMYGTLINTNISLLPASTMDNAGHIYMAGTCSANGSIAYSNQTTVMPAYGNFLAKLSPPSASLPMATRKPVATLFPNPASSTVTVQFTNTGYSHLTVTDAAGKTVYGQGISKGQRTVTLPVSSYPAGTYFVQLSGSAGTAGAKLTVAK